MSKHQPQQTIDPLSETSPTAVQGIVHPQHATRLGLLVGVLAICVSAAAGYMAYRMSRHVIIEQVTSAQLSLARAIGGRFASLASDHSHPNSIDSLSQLWRRATKAQRHSDRYMCVVQRDGTLAFNTQNTASIGRQVGGVPLLDAQPGGPQTLAELVASKQDYVGYHRTWRGEEQIAAFAYSEGLDALIAVHLPWSIVNAKIDAASRPWIIGSALSTLVFLPLALGLFHWSYRTSQRAADHAQGLLANLQSRAAPFRHLLLQQAEALALFAPDGRILDVNPQACRLLGYQPDEINDLRIWHLDVDLASHQVTDLWDQLDPDGTFCCERRYRHHDGSLVSVEVSFGRITLYRQTYILATLRDVSSQFQAAQIVLKNEHDRQRLGQNMHDSLSQELAGLVFLSRRIATQLTTQEHPEATLMTQLNTLLQSSLTQAQGLSHELYPVVLEMEGLHAALNNLVERCESANHLIIQLDAPPVTWPLHPDSHIHLYRIAQEALRNVVEHSQASHIWLTFTEHASNLQFQIDDDGVGRYHQSPLKAGMGVQNMRYRARLLGATLELESRPGGGTRVRCVLPPSYRLPAPQPSRSGSFAPVNASVAERRLRP